MELAFFRNITMREIYNWRYGSCFIFNADENELLASRTGPRHSLRLQVNVGQPDYLLTTSASGVRVIVHDSKVMPFPEDEGFSVAPGQLANIGVKMVCGIFCFLCY